MDTVRFCREVGLRVRAKRKAVGLTQRELSSRAGVSERLLRAIENGEAPGASIERVLAVLSELDIGLELVDASENSRVTQGPSYSNLLRQAVGSWRGGDGS